MHRISVSYASAGPRSILLSQHGLVMRSIIRVVEGTVAHDRMTELPCLSMFMTHLCALLPKGSA